MHIAIISIMVLAVFFVIIGIHHRKEVLKTDQETLTVGIIPLYSAIFVVIGSGEYALSANNVISYGFVGLSFLIALSATMIVLIWAVPKILDVKARSHNKLLFDKY